MGKPGILIQIGGMRERKHWTDWERGIGLFTLKVSRRKTLIIVSKNYGIDRDSAPRDSLAFRGLGGLL